MQATLIVGVSGGVGLATAKKFLSSGQKAIGLDIKEPKESLEGLTFIKTDITNESEILSAFNFVKEKGYTLENIICCAGIYELNSLVEMSEKEFIRVFDINVFSLYRINKIFLPLLNPNRKIIMISSELGPLDPLPFTGIYSISKALVEKYAYSLRMELQLLGYKVVVIRPGAIDTGMIDVSTSKLEKFTENTNYYKCNSKKFKEIVDSVESKKIAPSKIANLIYKVSNKKKPKYAYKINRNKGLVFLNLMPQRFQNWIIKKILTPKEKK